MYKKFKMPLIIISTVAIFLSVVIAGSISYFHVLAKSYLPSGLRASSVKFGGTWFKKLYLYDLDAVALQNVRSGGLKFLTENIQPVGKRRARLVTYRWYSTPAVQGSSLTGDLSLALGKTSADAFAGFRELDVAPPASLSDRTTFNGLRKALQLPGSYVGIGDNGRVVMIINPSTGKALISDGDL